MDPAAARLLPLLRERGETVATAESLTGGRLAARITSVPGASLTFVGGVVSYATSVKVQVLGVPRELVERRGVVSAECAQAMATGVRSLLGTTYGVSTTGVAGPDPQDGLPQGTVFVGLAGPDETTAVALTLTGDRQAIQAATCDAAVAALFGVLHREHGGLR
ncbi:MAG: CinA family protein [Nocardioidaceae bacterium]